MRSYIPKAQGVESSPPERPRTSFLELVCFSLFARPVDCIRKISSQFAFLFAWDQKATKGILGITRISFSFEVRVSVKINFCKFSFYRRFRKLLFLHSIILQDAQGQYPQESSQLQRNTERIRQE